MALRNENPTTTDRLQEVLKSTHPEDIDTYLKENRDKLLREERPFYAFMKKQFREKGFRQQEVFLAAGIPESYGYKLITEEKHTRQRDVILRLCLGAHFNKRAERIPQSSKRSVGGGMNFGKARFFFCISY